jgi:site-specific DNA-methyltransferase (adenine-specific)
MPKLRTNTLYYGDNLEVLRDHIPDESIDLIYLDPPFNSNRSYNVLFKEAGKGESPAQIEAFEDTWATTPSGSFTARFSSRHETLSRRRRRA